MFQWTARKNPVALLRAYAAAFDGDTGTVLTLKIHRHSDPVQNRAFAQNAVSRVVRVVVTELFHQLDQILVVIRNCTDDRFDLLQSFRC